MRPLAEMLDDYRSVLLDVLADAQAEAAAAAGLPGAESLAPATGVSLARITRDLWQFTVRPAPRGSLTAVRPRRGTRTSPCHP